MALSTDDILEPYQYTYAESLHLEAFKASKSLTDIDLTHLASLGVIDLSTDPSGEKKMSLSPSAPEQKEKKAAKPRATSAKREKRVEPQKDREEQKPIPQVAVRTPIPEATLATLTPAQKTILEAIPDDGTLSADAIYALELPRADLMAALTMLEIMGLVQKLPGSLYKKA